MVIDGASWANIMPVTTEGNVVLIAHSMVIAAFAFMGLVKPTPKE